LWGVSAEPIEGALIDLWESYLEKDKAAAKANAPQRVPVAKKIAVKPSPAGKLGAQSVSMGRPRSAPLPSIKLGSVDASRKKKKSTVAAGRARDRNGRGSARTVRKSR
jgi:hypothetical protein